MPAPKPAPKTAAKSTALPIEEALPDLLRALSETGRAVLQAPPGAGKTTRVPLAVLEARLSPGRIIMLEPRRLAARAAAHRMAQTLGEPVGRQVGYRIRGDTRVSEITRIEVVTEGILTRMLQSDPELPGVGMVVFDEFHERSLNADLGLALCLEVCAALRDDLKLLVMSATLDAAPVAALMQAPVVTSAGRSYPVDIRWRDTPLPAGTRRVDAASELVETAVAATAGGVLVFLPGEGEIRQVAARLAGRLPPACDLRQLYGAMPFAAQRAAIEPAAGRKVVLATSIAETSLTIPDITAVVDAGLSRRARFDPGSGMSRLVTERVTRAEAEQRAGRAGRVAAGQCFRLWTRGEHGALMAQPPAEIEAGDLCGLALELALWGTSESELGFLTAPPAGALGEARALLHRLGALQADGRITPHGRRLAAMPLHPRLAHMIAVAGKDAALLAALLSDRDPLRGAPSDASLRLEALRDTRAFRKQRAYEVREDAIARIRSDAKRLSRLAGPGKGLTPGAMAALAYPDRIGQRRQGEAPRYVLSGGKGAVMAPDDPMARLPYIVVLDSDGDPREARIRLAAEIGRADLDALFAGDMETVELCAWSRRERRVLARRQSRLGALVLEDEAWKDVSDTATARAMCEGIRLLGLNLGGAAERYARRVEMARLAGQQDLPETSEAALLDTLEAWLAPYLGGIRDGEAWRRFDPLPALRARLDWAQQQNLDSAAPPAFETPLGRKVAIDYEPEGPAIALRLQELFGVTRHPEAAGAPVKITLLSPAGRPVQVTRDLPGFWAGSYADVRKDMRARYPRHPWPEDPTRAAPTLRAKPRGSR